MCSWMEGGRTKHNLKSTVPQPIHISWSIGWVHRLLWHDKSVLKDCGMCGNAIFKQRDCCGACAGTGATTSIITVAGNAMAQLKV